MNKIHDPSKSLINIQRDYINKICKSVEGLKCMIFDKVTSELISLNFLQSEGFELEVFLFEDIKNIKNEKLNYVSAIYMITSKQENLNLLCDELKNPNFKEYHIFFLSDVSDDIIRKFAEYDEQDLIKSLQRIYCNYHAINHEFFHSNTKNLKNLFNKTIDQWDPKDRFNLNAMEESILSSLCSLRKIPTIRYLKDSELSTQLADRLSTKFKKLSMTYLSEFDKNSTLLLIMERKEDPFTPLLMHWSYQSLLHELLTINNNKIKAKGEEYNLNLQHDKFYSDNIFSNYGEVATHLKNSIESLSHKKKQQKEIKKFEDMQKLLSEMQDFKKDTSITKKHISLTDELSKIVGRRNLLKVSKLQQQIVSKNSKKEQFREIIELLEDKNIYEYDKFILVAIFCLKYDDGSENDKLKSTLFEKLPHFKITFDKLFEKCNKNKRISSKLFSENFGDKAFQMYKDFFAEMPNVYELHMPFVAHIIEYALKCKLGEDIFEYIDAAPLRDVPQTIIVYIIGGATFCEAKHFADLNKKYQDKLFVLGGSSLINSKIFFNDYIGVSVD